MCIRDSFGHGCGIVSSEQHTDVESSVFYQRIVFDAAELHTDRVSLERGIEEVAGRLGMTCEVRWPKPKRVAIFVSKYAHCLWELFFVKARRRRAAGRRDRADRQ